MTDLQGSALSCNERLQAWKRVYILPPACIYAYNATHVQCTYTLYTHCTAQESVHMIMHVGTHQTAVVCAESADLVRRGTGPRATWHNLGNRSSYSHDRSSSCRCDWGEWMRTSTSPRRSHLLTRNRAPTGMSERRTSSTAGKRLKVCDSPLAKGAACVACSYEFPVALLHLTPSMLHRSC